MLKRPSRTPRQRPREDDDKILRVLLDEGAPVSVGVAFERNGYEVIHHKQVLEPGAKDQKVAETAIANKAVLIAVDNDMKRLSGKYHQTDDKFKSLSLIKIACPEPLARSRIEEAFDLLLLEWRYRCAKRSRRMYIEIGQHFIRTNR